MKTSALLMMLTSLSCMAAPLTPEQALNRALQGNITAARTKAIAESKTAYDFAGTQGNLYIFNRAGNSGFIITPSDSGLPPVLASVSSGTFDPTSMPEAMKWLLGQYEQAAQTVAENAAYSVPDYYLDWTAIDPIVKSKWDQGSPYNDRCPVVYGSITPTGCVATAMAQILYHHRYAKGQGSISYRLYIDNSTQSFDFDNAKFDFDAMTDTYSSSSTVAAKEAVAELMEACGKAVQMNYGPGGSSAITGHIPNALITYFGYDTHTTVCNREEYQTEQWETIIYNELLENRPVLYSGNTEQGSGHAFVCDGYDGNGLFHINWGWSGSSDGYFSLTALKPGQVGIGAQPGGFNNIQQIVAIVPPGAENFPDTDIIEPTEPVDITLADVEISPLSTGNEMTVTFTAINRGITDLYTMTSRLLLYKPGTSSPIAYGDEVRSYAVAAGDSRRETFRMKLITDKGDPIPTGNYELRVCNSNEQALSSDAVFDVTVTDEPLKDIPFTHSGQITIGDATESIPAIIINSKPLKLTPSVRNDDAYTPVAIGLALFSPGTDNAVWTSTLQTMTVMNTNGSYIPDFPYLNMIDLRNVAAGTYDAAFVTTGNQIISERRRVNIAEIADNIAYSVVADGSAAMVVRHTYSGDVVIPAEVTLSDGRTLPVTTLGEETFLNNNDVTSVDLPATLTSIGLHSLRYLSNVQTLRFRSATVPFIHIAIAAYRMNPRVRIPVPSQVLDDYTAAMFPYQPEADTESAITEITTDRKTLPADAIYDLQGRRVTSPRPGQLYITPSGKFRL